MIQEKVYYICFRLKKTVRDEVRDEQQKVIEPIFFDDDEKKIFQRK